MTNMRLFEENKIFIYYDFFFYLGFLSRVLVIHRTAKEEIWISFFLFYPFHRLTDFSLKFWNRDDYLVVSIAMHVIIRLSLDEISRLLGTVIWLIWLINAEPLNFADLNTFVKLFPPWNFTRGDVPCNTILLINVSPDMSRYTTP